VGGMEDGAQENAVPAEVPPVKKEAAAPASTGGGGGGWGGWGGWGTSALSVFTDLQKAAVEVADEISKNVRIICSKSLSLVPLLLLMTASFWLRQNRLCEFLLLCFHFEMAFFTIQVTV
jgi:hypothetical protein